MLEKGGEVRAWGECLDQVRALLKRYETTGVRFPFFRGQGRSSWQLLPTLHREGLLAYEVSLYNDFVTSAGPLLRGVESSWDVLFEMRQHGMPTRLLDWTQNFAVALYFATRHMHTGKSDEGAVWILEPLCLNEQSIGEPRIYSPLHQRDAYSQMFIVKADLPIEGAVAMTPVQNSLRAVAQQAVCTLHGQESRPLEDQCPEAVAKVLIPLTALGEAREFLFLAGMNEYTLFPDLDGLGRHLTEQYVLQRKFDDGRATADPSLRAH